MLHPLNQFQCVVTFLNFNSVKAITVTLTAPDCIGGVVGGVAKVFQFGSLRQILVSLLGWCHIAERLPTGYSIHTLIETQLSHSLLHLIPFEFALLQSRWKDQDIPFCVQLQKDTGLIAVAFAHHKP